MFQCTESTSESILCWFCLKIANLTVAHTYCMSGIKLLFANKFFLQMKNFFSKRKKRLTSIGADLLGPDRKGLPRDIGDLLYHSLSQSLPEDDDDDDDDDEAVARLSGKQQPTV